MGNNDRWSGPARGLRKSESGKALLVEVDEQTAWIPQSQIDEDPEVWRPGDTGELVIPQWLAEEKGFC